MGVPGAGRLALRGDWSRLLRPGGGGAGEGTGGFEVIRRVVALGAFVLVACDRSAHELLDCVAEALCPLFGL